MAKIKEGYKETEIGIIPEGWKVTTVGQCVNKIVGGGTPARSNIEFYNGIIPWVTVKDLDNKFYKSDALEHITEEAVKNSATNLIEENSIIVATRMGLGRGFINTVPMAINQDLKALYLKANIDSEFFLFWYLSKASEIENLGTGTTVKGIRLETLKDISLSIPPLPEQHGIAEILSTTDGHIEKLDKTIEDYQLLKKGMMRKLLTEGIGHTEFKETEIGRITKEWRIVTLGEIGDFKNGVNKGKNDFGFGTKFVNIEDVYKSRIIQNSSLKLINVNEREVDTYELYDGDIILVRSSVKPEGIGYPALYRETVGERVVYCGFTIRFRLNTEIEINHDFLVYQLLSHKVRKQVISLSTVSANTNINQESYSKVIIAIPGVEEQKYIAELLSGIDDRIDLLNREREDFIQLKRALMERLLTGKIRVNQ